MDNETKRKGLVEKMKAHKLMSAMAFMVVMMLASVSAYYIYTYNNPLVFTVGGGAAELVITQDFASQPFLVNESQEWTQELLIDNQNSLVPMSFNLDKEVTLLDPGCAGIDDVNFTMIHNGTIIAPNDTFDMMSGLNSFVLNASVENTRTCPQEISYNITFSEI